MNFLTEYLDSSHRDRIDFISFLCMDDPCVNRKAQSGITAKSLIGKLNFYKPVYFDCSYRGRMEFISFIGG